MRKNCKLPQNRTDFLSTYFETDDAALQFMIIDVTRANTFALCARGGLTTAMQTAAGESGKPQAFQTLQSVFVHEGEIPAEFTSKGAVWDGSGLYRSINDFVIFHKVRDSSPRPRLTACSETGRVARFGLSLCCSPARFFFFFFSFFSVFLFFFF